MRVVVVAAGELGVGVVAAVVVVAVVRGARCLARPTFLSP